MRALVSFLYRHRVAAASAALGFAALMLSFTPRLEIDNSVEAHFAEDDPALQAYRRTADVFGADQVLIVGIHGKADILQSDRLSRLARVTTTVRDVDGVSRVTSLSTVLASYARSPGLISNPIHQLRLSLEDDGLAARLVSDDLKTTVLLVGLDPADKTKHAQVLDRVRTVLETSLEGTGEKFSIGGVAVLQDAVNAAMLRDGRRSVILTYLLIILVFIVMMRRLVWTLLAVVVVTLSNCVTVGAMALLDRPVTLLAMAVPTLVMVLGVANVIHMTLHLEREGVSSVANPEEGLSARSGRSGASAGAKPSSEPQVLTAALAFVAWPCLLNALTTAGGFLSLQTASLAVTRDYGLFAALGILFAFVFSLIGAAILLPYAARTAQRASAASLLTAASVRLVRIGLRHRRAVLVISGIIGTAALYGSSLIVIDTSIVDLLPPSHTVREDGRRLETALGPFLPLDFQIELDSAGAWKDPAVLGAFSRVSTAIERDSTLGRATSIVDLLREVRRASTGRPLEEGWLPTSSSQVDAYLNLGRRGIGAQYIDDLVGENSRSLRFTVTLPTTTGRGVGDREERVRALLQTELQDEASVRATGYLPLYAAFSTRIAGDQARGLAVAILIVVLLIGIALRSGILTAIAAPPNFLPILIMLAVMGVGGIFLDIATVTVATSVIGIVVDDSVHMLYRFKRGLREELNVEEAMIEAARTSGVAIMTTTIIFCAGFLILTSADIRQLSNIGMLTAIAVFAALLADLLLLPALAAASYDRWRSFRQRYDRIGRSKIA